MCSDGHSGMLLHQYKLIHWLLNIIVNKESTVTFEVFVVLWLRNLHYYTRDIIGIKMMHRDLPYYESQRRADTNKRHQKLITYRRFLRSTKQSLNSP